MNNIQLLESKMILLEDAILGEYVKALVKSKAMKDRLVDNDRAMMHKGYRSLTSPDKYQEQRIYKSLESYVKDKGALSKNINKNIVEVKAFSRILYAYLSNDRNTIKSLIIPYEGRDGSIKLTSIKASMNTL